MSEREFEGHEALIAQLRAGTLDAPDHLHRRVLAGGQVKRRRWAEMSGRKRVFVLVPVAAALAVGAAVVHGAFFAGSKTAANHAPALLPKGAPFPTGATAATGPTGPAVPRGANGASAATVKHGLALNGSSALDQAAAPKAVQGAYSADFNPAVTIPTNRRVHVDATLRVAVANAGALSTATNRATQIVTSLGGYTQNSQFQASHAGSGYAVLELRVPVGKISTAITKLGKLGRLVQQQVSTKDLQQKYTKQTDTIGRLQRAIAIYQQALQSGTLSGSQLVTVQVELSNAEHQLTMARKAHGRTAASAATANLELTLTTKQHAVIVHPGKRGRLGRLLHNAAGFLGLEAIIVLYALIVAAPIVLLVALVWWVMRERRRREERLLANA